MQVTTKSVVSQDGTLVAYFYRKFISTQQKYITIEQKLLGIIGNFKKVQTILLGNQITVYTNNKKVTYSRSDYSSDKVLR